MDKIPSELLAAPVRGVNLMPGSLGDQLGTETTLLVFLRHFGCGFCKETLAELRAASETPGYPPVLLFYQGSPTEGRAFLRRQWPAVRAVSDPELHIYEAFGVRRGRVRDFVVPGVWSARRRALDKGHRNGERSGDIWRMPGVFLAREDAILWRHHFRHVGDHPDFGGIAELAQVHA